MRKIQVTEEMRDLWEQSCEDLNAHISESGHRARKAGCKVCKDLNPVRHVLSWQANGNLGQERPYRICSNLASSGKTRVEVASGWVGLMLTSGLVTKGGRLKSVPMPTGNGDSPIVRVTVFATTRFANVS